MAILLGKNLLLFMMYLKQVNCYGCGQAEYNIHDECCPMCSPGNRVYRHCTAYTSTSCIPCEPSTFTDRPNGAEQCSRCTVCDLSLGLNTVRICTLSSNTVCGILEGHYCIDTGEGGCKAAYKHTDCTPGQFIKQSGTESTDTVCEDCENGSYSNGSFTSCKSHTDCESKGRVTVTPGDRSSDSVCEEKDWTAVIATLGIFGILAVAAAAAAAGLYKLYRSHKMCRDSGHKRKNPQEPVPEILPMM